MKFKKIKPYNLIIWTFLSVILMGTFLLMLPIASTSRKSFGFVNSFFMSTSAVCVTGLSVLDLSAQMSIFGRVVMCFLMEIGGLSFITLAVFFFTIFGAKIGVSNRFLLKEALNQNSLKGVVALVRKIVTISLFIQLLGFLVNIYPLYKWCGSVIDALGYSAFHSIASFNNAGFDIFGPNSMEIFNANVWLNVSTILLIIFGGIGFVVLTDIFSKKNPKKFSLHTKLVLSTTCILIVGGTIIYKLSTSMTFLEALFSTVTCRTAGFATYDFGKMSMYPAAYCLTLFLMVVGASPCSTGGGIKTTTFAVLMLGIYSHARSKSANAFSRKISDGAIAKAFVLITIAIGVMLVGTTIVGAIQPELGLESILFEVTSAFSTTGLSMGITRSLCNANKLVLCIIMFIGRIGPLTIIGLLNRKDSAVGEEFNYVEESVIIG